MTESGSVYIFCQMFFSINGNSHSQYVVQHRMLCPTAEAALTGGISPIGIEEFIAAVRQSGIPFFAQIADDDLHM